MVPLVRSPEPLYAPRSRVRGAAVAVLALTLAAGCGGERSDGRIPLDRGGMDGAEALSPEIQVRLDSANAAYRARDYQRALDAYAEVTRLAPDLAAGWYGLGMTHEALGNPVAADSAMMRVHGLAPEIPLQHPSNAAPPNPHPITPHPYPSPEGRSRDGAGRPGG